MPSQSTSDTRSDDNQLTPRAERFCQAYALDPVGSRAARAAGYARKYAAQSASKLLRDRRVARRVDELRTDIADRTAAKPANVIEAYRRMSLTDPLSLLTVDDARKSADGQPLMRFKRPDEHTED